MIIPKNRMPASHRAEPEVAKSNWERIWFLCRRLRRLIRCSTSKVPSGSTRFCGNQRVGGAVEQVGRQAQRADPLELVHLAEQRLQAGPAGVSFELGQLLLPRPRRRGVDVGDQPLQAVGGVLVQPRHGGSTDPVGRGGAGAGYQLSTVT